MTHLTAADQQPEVAAGRNYDIWEYKWEILKANEQHITSYLKVSYQFDH